MRSSLFSLAATVLLKSERFLCLSIVSPERLEAYSRGFFYICLLVFLFHTEKRGENRKDNSQFYKRDPPRYRIKRKMKTILRMKCKACGHWNRFEVNKLFVEQPINEPKVKAYIPMYEPLKTETCEKCKNVLAEPNELIRIVHAQTAY
jgi:RNase P subunit RPR2